MNDHVVGSPGHLALRLARLFVEPADGGRTGAPAPSGDRDAGLLPGGGPLPGARRGKAPGAGVELDGTRRRTRTRAPGRRGRSRPPSGRTPAPAVAVVGAAGSAAFALELAGVLARRHRAGATLVCRHGAGVGPLLPGVGVPAARALAERLTARGHAVVPRRRAALLTLAEDERAAAAELARAGAAAGPVPVLLALAGPRGRAWAPVLAGQALVVLALPPGCDPLVGALAEAGFAGTAPVCVVEVGPRPRLLRLPGRRSSALAAVVEALG